MSESANNGYSTVNELAGHSSETENQITIQTQSSSPATEIASRRLMNVLLVTASLAGIVTYFIVGQTLLGTLILGALTLLTYTVKACRPGFDLARVLFAYCSLTFLISNLGIAYPYSNIFILTGLFGLFFISELGWGELFFDPGQTKKWTKPAFFSSLIIAGVISALFMWTPELLGPNPTPREWPVDVLIVVAIGYATFSTLMEEAIYRSVIMAFAKKRLGANLAIVSQATVFGALHFHVGFPSQTVGAALAFCWALLAGWIVNKANSIYPAFVMHFIIVLVLFLVLAFAPVG